jgi:hypothetical protein
VSRKKGKRRPVRIEGPCGDGSRKENLCDKGSDCCTGLCKTGLKNKDGRGRCRCVRRGKACAEDKNCCNDMTCVAGVCGGSAPPPTHKVANGQPCVAGVDTCEDPIAQCIEYGSGPEEFGAPTGTFCLYPDDAACTTPALSQTFCASGYCAPGATANDPAFCGDLVFTTECNSSTDSGAGATVYAPGPSYICGVSGVPSDNRNLMVASTPTTDACNSHSECFNPPNQVCVKNTSESSVFSMRGMPVGNYCAPGSYICLTTNDCPTAPQGYTASCNSFGSLPFNLCFYNN